MENKKPPWRVFLDSNVLISALIFPRWPYEILKCAETQEIKIVLCPLVIKEVLSRISITFPTQLDKLNHFITTGNYELVADPLKSELKKHPDLVRDKKDIPLAIAVIKAKVDYMVGLILILLNQGLVLSAHFIRLRTNPYFVSSDKDFTAKDKTTEQLRKYLQPLQPGTFLREVMDWTSEELEAIRHRTWQDLE